MTRIEKTFQRLADENKKAFIAFLTAGDPDEKTSAALLTGLADHADLIELGMPFTDPMADGPAIQAASQRALQAGMTLKKTLGMVRGFRQTNTTTPIVLMGYYNPIYIYGVAAFIKDALAAGVDGLIIADLPPEEDSELCLPARQAGLDFIRMATPTSDDTRLQKILPHASGFIYYVSISGITGAGAPEKQNVAEAVARIKAQTNLPLCVGFGIKTAQAAQEFARLADGVVVGSALVEQIAATLTQSGQASPETLTQPLALAQKLALSVKEA